MELTKDLLEQLAQNVNRDLIRKESVESLEKIDYITDPISYEQFLQKYMIRNVPCLLANWATAPWLSRLSWCDNTQINWNFLNSKFGECTVPITDCTGVTDYAQSKLTMKMSDYIKYMQEYISHEELDDKSLESSSVKRLLYLKDWHFVRECPDYPAYSTPTLFSSDWLNEYWDARNDSRDDYRFVYIGPAGSWTPFHADVFRSFSWSANICGRKKWIIYPAGHETSLCDVHGMLPNDVTSIQNLPQSSSPVKRFEVVQNAGEIIFVPSGWHHQVYNEEDTISINHNWFNGCNIDICWNFIKSRLEDVRTVIAEHKDTMDDWHQHCQLMLKADCGMDYTEFYVCLQTVASARITFLNSTTYFENDPDTKQKRKTVASEKKFYTVTDRNHAVFDMLQLYPVLCEVSSLLLDCLNIDHTSGIYSDPQQLLFDIRKTLSLCGYAHLFPTVHKLKT